MTRQRRTVLRTASVCGLAAALAVGQGPGSCGFHLDLLTDLTSTHAAVADVPGALGTGPGVPPGFPGSPYTAYATPGTPVRFVLSCPAEMLGPAPTGSLNLVSILYAIGAAGVALPSVPPFVAACGGPFSPITVSVLPIGGALIDGNGLVSPAPILPPVSLPFPGRLEVTVIYPPGLPGPLTFQAVLALPGGAVALSNGVSIFPGANPGEISLVPGLVPSAPPLAATDEGQALGVPTPPGFTFYGFPAPACDVDVNGFIDFLPGAATGGGADFAGTVGDFGCAVATATARPRVDVNHADLDLAVLPPPFLVTDLTMELAPPFPPTPARTIIRWKNVMSFGAVAGTDSHRSCCVELWGDGRIVVVRQRAANNVVAALHDQIGVGPGLAAHLYGGPPPAGPTCGAVAGIPFAPIWGFPAFLGLPAGVIHMDALLPSVAFSNLAAEFVPMVGPPPIAYGLAVH